MTNFQPSLYACLERGCRYMAGDKKRTVCLIGDKVLEDLSECPYDAAVKKRTERDFDGCQNNC